MARNTQFPASGTGGRRNPPRVNHLLVAFLLGYATLAGRLTYLQVYKHDDLAAYVEPQRVQYVAIHARDGGVYDSQMAPFAVNAFSGRLSYDPYQIYPPAASQKRLNQLQNRRRVSIEFLAKP